MEHKGDEHQACDSHNGRLLQSKCNCFHHSMIPVLALVLAIVFLLKSWGILSSIAVDMIWPILVGIGALTKLSEDKCKCC